MIILEDSSEVKDSRDANHIIVAINLPLQQLSFGSTFSKCSLIKTSQGRNGKNRT